MKKILLSCLLASTSISFYAQSIFNENFEALTLGNLGTDITGTTAGQGGWYTTAATTAANSAVTNFQVTNITLLFTAKSCLFWDLRVLQELSRLTRTTS